MELLLGLVRMIIRFISPLIFDEADEANFKSPSFNFTKFVFLLFVLAVCFVNLWLTFTLFKAAREIERITAINEELTLMCTPTSGPNKDKYLERSPDGKTLIQRSFNSPPPASKEDVLREPQR